jgi:hypothetical protein
MDERLTFISGSQPLALGPTDGQETLACAADVFRYIDSNFEHWNCDVARAVDRRKFGGSL